MNVGKAIYYLLANNANVSALTTRIYPEVAPQDAALPFVVYRVTSVSPDDTHDGPAVIDEVRVDVICVSDSYDEAADLSSKARVALDRVYGTYNTVNVESIQFDNVAIYVRDNPRQYGQESTFIVRVKRDDVQIATGSPIEDLNLWRLADVDDDIVNALDRQALVYDEATSTWINDGVGQVVIPVRNVSRDDSIAVGTVLKATGAQGDRVLVAPFEPDTDDMKYLVGIASEVLGNTNDTKDGHAQVYGELRNLNTDLYDVGTVLYAAAGGTLSTTENQYPIAIVTRKQENTGRIFIRMWTPGKGYHQRYRTEALAEMFVGVGATVELYYTATADGDGFVTQDLTAAVAEGNVEERVLRYKSGAFGDSGTTTGYTDAGLATDATYAEMLTAFNNLLATESAPITIYATRTEVSARTGLLVDYPGAAAAYSLRLLDTDYTGSAIRVRRASDNAEQDIGFSNGDLDTTSLATFCSGTDGFVKTWYDQAGSNNATQTQTGSQPKIYDSVNGVMLDEDNNLPAALFTGSYLNSGAVTGTGTATNFVVANISGGSTTRALFFTPECFALFQTFDWRVFSSNVQISYAGNEQGLLLHYFGADSSGNFGAINGGILTTSSNPAGSNTKIAIGTQASNVVPFYGYVQECVYYSSDQSSNRTGIESNINDYYSIYP